MNDNDPPSRWRHLDVEARFRLAALVVAGIGGFASAAIWFGSDEVKIDAIEFSRSRAQEFQLERLGGKFAVMSAQIGTWFDGLWVGRTLGLTLGVLTVVAVVVLLTIGRLASPGDDVRRR
jgi:hypothetical protein